MVAESGTGHLNWRVGEDQVVNDDGVRPFARCRPLSSVDQYDGLVIGETVDAGRRLNDNVGEAEFTCDDLADVSHRSRAHRDEHVAREQSNVLSGGTDGYLVGQHDRRWWPRRDSVQVDAKR